MRIGKFYIGKKPMPISTGTSQSRASWDSPWLNAFYEVPNDQPYKLYKLMRDAIPCLDLALSQTARLCGTLEVVTDEPLKSDIETFMENVKVNHVQNGLMTALRSEIRQRLQYGPAAIEIVPNNAGDDIYALANIESETIVFKPSGRGNLEVDVAQRQQGQGLPVVLDRNWITVSVHEADANPNGRSLFASLPFTAEIFMKMEESLGKNWERFGVPAFHVNWTPPEGFSDSSGQKTAGIMKAFEANFNKAMKARKKGEVRDFFTSGAVTVSVIGADGQTLDFSIDGKALLEQIVGRTGLPSWMLGFNWSTTERLSTQQADVLISYINSVQDESLYTAKFIIQRWLDLTGREGEFDLKWNAVSLQDAVQTAQAEYAQANADKTRETVGTSLWRNGIFTQEQYAEYVLGERFDGEIAEQKDTPTAVTVLGPSGGIDEPTPNGDLQDPNQALSNQLPKGADDGTLPRSFTY